MSIKFNIILSIIINEYVKNFVSIIIAFRYHLTLLFWPMDYAGPLHRATDGSAEC